MSTQRREARAKARSLILNANPAQLDHWRDSQSRESFKDWMLRLIETCPYTALAVLGA